MRAKVKQETVEFYVYGGFTDDFKQWLSDNGLRHTVIQDNRIRIELPNPYSMQFNIDTVVVDNLDKGNFIILKNRSINVLFPEEFTEKYYI